MTLQPNPYSKNNFIWDLSNHEEDANLNKSDQDYKSNLSPSVSDETIGSDESPSQSAGSSRQNTSSNAYNLYWATQNSLFRPILTSTSIINNLTQSYSDASEEFYGSSLECSRSSSECSRSSSSSSIQNSPSHPILTSTSILNNLSKSDSDMLEEFHDSSVECPRSSSSSSSQATVLQLSLESSSIQQNASNLSQLTLSLSQGADESPSEPETPSMQNTSCNLYNVYWAHSSNPTAAHHASLATALAQQSESDVSELDMIISQDPEQSGSLSLVQTSRSSFDGSDEAGSSSASSSSSLSEHVWKKSRTVTPVSKNLAPTTMLEDGVDPDELIKDHAEMRIVLMYLRLLAVRKLGVRSDGSLSNIKVEVKHANHQHGQGSKAKNTNAAHPDTMAGGKDNIREESQAQIIQEHRVTPKKEKLLLAKGFSSEAIEILKDPSTTEKQVKKIYAKYWQKVHEHESVLSGTALECTLNATNELDRHVNVCNSALELAIRPKIAGLVRKVMINELSPEKGIKKYHKLILNYFNNVVSNFSSKTILLEDYIKDLDLIKSSKITSKNDLAVILGRMNNSQKKIEAASQGVPSIGLSKNKAVLKSTIKNLNKTSTPNLRKLYLQKYTRLQKEVAEKLVKIKMLARYNLLEREATILPPLDLYSAGYDSKAQFKMLQAQPLKELKQQAKTTKTNFPKNSVAKKPINTI